MVLVVVDEHGEDDVQEEVAEQPLRCDRVSVWASIHPSRHTCWCIYTLAVNQPVMRSDRRCWCGKRQQRNGDGSDGGERRSRSRNVIVASLVEVGVVTPPLWGRPLWTPRRHCSH